MGGTRIFWGGQRGDQFFFQCAKGGAEFFEDQRLGDQYFFSMRLRCNTYVKGGTKKNGERPSQTDTPLPVKYDNSLI